MRGEHASLEEIKSIKNNETLAYTGKKKLTIPFHFPNFTLNRYSIKAFNMLYYHKQRSQKQQSIINYEPYFYPLDAIWDWNKIYGKNGFTQYQFVIPKDVSRKGLEAVLNLIAKSGEGSFLAVLKLFGKSNPDAMISFPFEGYTLALDFKISPKVMKLLDELDSLIAQLGGRLYLTKDSRMSVDMLSQGYSELNQFKNIVGDSIFSSFQSNRLNIN